MQSAQMFYSAQHSYTVLLKVEEVWVLFKEELWQIVQESQ